MAEVSLGVTVGYGDPRTAGGKVRKGKPSGSAFSQLCWFNTPSTPLGYGEFKSLRESPYPWGKRRMDYCVWMRIPATSRRNPTNPDKIGTQPAKKNRKNQQKSIVKFLNISDPGGPPEPLESVREPSRTRPSEENAKKRFLAEKKS